MSVKPVVVNDRIDVLIDAIDDATQLVGLTNGEQIACLSLMLAACLVAACRTGGGLVRRDLLVAVLAAIGSSPMADALECIGDTPEMTALLALCEVEVQR